MYATVLTHEPIEENDMTHDIEMDASQMDKIATAKTALDNIIKEAHREEGLEDKNPLEFTQSDRDRVKQRLMQNTGWRFHMSELIKTLSPTTEITDEILGKIDRPHWNEILLSITGITHDTNGRVHTSFVPGHSFLTQTGIQNPSSNYPSSSIGGGIVSSDGKVTIGLRGGLSYSDTYMLAPAGYISANPSNSRHPLIVNFLTELFTELGLTEEDITDLVQVGTVFNTANNNMPIFTATTPNMHSDRIAELARSAQDAHEHKAVEAVNADNLISFVLEKGIFEESHADPKRHNRTTKANEGTILPQAAISLLAIAQHISTVTAEQARNVINAITASGKQAAQTRIQGHINLRVNTRQT